MERRDILRKLYECMPPAEREWLARSAFLAAVLLVGAIVAVALAPGDTSALPDVHVESR
jgi:hypothetical protein